MKKCALVIGHKKSSSGASNQSSNLSEFDFNDKLAIEIEQKVSGVEVQRVYRRTINTLPHDINDLNPDFIISLHCNAFNQSASGTEVLYYHRSKKGKEMASALNTRLVKALGLNNRGIKAKSAEDRGGSLLKNTNAPCVIAEPFFIDNDSDLKMANDNREQLVKAYANGIKAIAKLI